MTIDRFVIEELDRIVDESSMDLTDMTDITEGEFFAAFRNVSNIHLFCGATKGAIAPDDFNYVFKIPFAHLTYNYCSEEVKVYQAAKKAHLEMYFAACEPVTAKNNVTFVVQEKVTAYEDADWSNWCDYSLELRNTSYNKQDEYSIAEEMPEEWIGDFIYCYGEEAFDKLCYFLEDNNVNDLHSGNIGYIGNTPVIFDYAGWYD